MKLGRWTGRSSTMEKAKVTGKTWYTYRWEDRALWKTEEYTLIDFNLHL